MVRSGIYFADYPFIMKKIKTYTIILLVILFCVCRSALAFMSENEASLLDLINQIRTAPFAYALALGYDQEFLAEMDILPETQFEPYLMDEYLCSSAADSNYSLTGEDKEPVEKLPVHLLTAETGGVVSFFNFMPVEVAFKIVIDNFLRKELETSNFQYILSNVYSYLGISIKAGALENRMNAWFFAVNFGSSTLKSEVQVLNMINQVRSEPWKVQAYIDRKIIDLYHENLNVLYLLRRKYSPLFLNASLHASAQANSFSVLYETYSEATVFTPLERAMDNGYKGGFVQESVVDAAYEKDNLISCVNTVFSTLILDEFKTWPEGAAVFSSDFQDIGPGLSLRSGDDFDRAVLSIYVGTDMDIKEDDVQQISRIYGIIFSDIDQNNVYSPGEEIVRENVVIYGEYLEPIKSVVTDNAGHFSVTLESNKKYFFRAESEGFSVTKEILLTASDQFVKLVYP